MKLETYRPNIEKNTIQGQFDAGVNSAAYGINQSGLTSLGKVAEQVRLDMQARIDEDNKVDLLNATTQYQQKLNELLYNDENGLAHTMLEGAAGTDIKFQEEEAKIREEIMGKIRYQKVREEFQQHADTTKMGYAKNMELHVRNERDKYKDVSFENSVNTITQSNVLSYANPELVKENGKLVKQMIQNMYGDKGEEFVKNKAGKVIDDMALQTLQEAERQKNYEAFPALISEFRSMGASEDILSKAYSISQEVLSAVATNKELPTLYSQHGDNIDAAAEALLKKEEDGAKDLSKLDELVQQNEGKPYVFGADGDNATDCGKYTQDVFAKMGITLKYRTADGQYRELEESGKTFTDKSKLKKGDLVFWHVPANESRWATSDDPNSINSGDKAYKGITHVGIYMGAGKVSQAGTSSGVGTISLDSYPVVGFGEVSKPKLTESQRLMRKEKIKKEYGAFVAQKKREEAEALQKKIEAIELYKIQAEKQGLSLGETAQGMENMVGGDKKLLLKFGHQINVMRKMQERANAEATQANGNNVSVILKMIANGEGRHGVYKKIEDSGLVFSTSDMNKINIELDKSEKGEGQYRLNAGHLKESVRSTSGMSKADFDAAWPAAMAIANSERLEYKKENGGVEPPDVWIQGRLNGALAEQKIKVISNPFYMTDEYVNVSPAQLRRIGYKSMAPNTLVGEDGGQYIRVYSLNYDPIDNPEAFNDIPVWDFKKMIEG